MKKDSLFGWLAGLSVAGGVVLFVMAAVLGPLNQDEGLYLLSARCVARHLVPYKDFFIPQGNALPYFYAMFQGAWYHPGSLLGVALSARLFTGLLSLLAGAIAASMAASWVPRPRRKYAALTAWLLVACVPFHAYYGSIPKTYALASVFLMLGFVFLGNIRRVRPAAFNAGVAFGLATATRLSLAPVLPAACLLLWLAPGKDERRSGFRHALFCGFGAVFSLGLSLGVAAVRYPKQFKFAMDFQKAREIGGALQWAANRAGFLSRFVQDYPLACLLALGLGLWCLASRNSGRKDPLGAGEDGKLTTDARVAYLTAGTASAAVTALHFLMPFPYDDYQVPVMPLAAAALAAALFRRLPETDAWPRRAVVAAFAGTVLLSLGSPLLFDFVALRQDRIWFEMKKKPDVLVLRDVGRRVRQLADEQGNSGLLFTQDAYLAVEAGLGVPRGLEMGPFAFFPKLTDEEARFYRVCNANTFHKISHSYFAPPVAAMSGYSYAISSPELGRTLEADRDAITKDIEERYILRETIPDFGQAHTPLKLYLLASPADPSEMFIPDTRDERP